MISIIYSNLRYHSISNSKIIVENRYEKLPSILLFPKYSTMYRFIKQAINFDVKKELF